MRLIDVEKFFEEYDKGKTWGYYADNDPYEYYDLTPYIEAATVEAIPVEWLIKTQDEYSQRYGEVYKAVVMNLIEDWRKENG